jgi:hypothetical protein
MNSGEVGGADLCFVGRRVVARCGVQRREGVFDRCRGDRRLAAQRYIGDVSTDANPGPVGRITHPATTVDRQRDIIGDVHDSSRAQLGHNTRSRR